MSSESFHSCFFTTVNSLWLTNTVLESSSKRRLVFLKQETTYVAGWIVFVVSTIEDRLPRGTKCCRRLKKKTVAAFYCLFGGWGGKKGMFKFPPPRRRCFSLFQSAFSMPFISPFGNKLKLFVYKSLILKLIRPRKAKPRTFHERNQISSWKVRRLAWMSLDRPTLSIRLQTDSVWRWSPGQTSIITSDKLNYCQTQKTTWF